MCSSGNHNESDNIDTGYLLGFDIGPLTTIVGMTKECVNHKANLNVVGMFYTKPDITLDRWKEFLMDIVQNKLPHTNKDKMHIIYGPDQEQTDKLKAKYLCTKTQEIIKGCDFNLVEDNKIYAHSAIAIIRANLKLNVFNLDKKPPSLTKDTITAAIKQAQESLEASCLVQLDDSALKLDYPKQLSKLTALTESLYDSLDAPSSVKNSGDYLPNASKKDLEKLVVKWRNKAKEQREILKFTALENDLVVSMNNLDIKYDESKQYYIQSIEAYTYVHMKDPLSKTCKALVQCLKNQLVSVQKTLTDFYVDVGLPFYRPCPFNFKPDGVSHFISTTYASDKNIDSGFNNDTRRIKMKEARRTLHENFVLPLNKPIFRIANNFNLTPNVQESAGYLCNVHLGLDSGIKGGLRKVIDGTYTYHHYMQDGKNDSGWGCAYRSLQTIVSWFMHQGYLSQYDNPSSKGKYLDRVPTHDEIQQALVDVGDKQKSFVGSSNWIGSQEVCYVLNQLYGIESKIMAVSSGSELVYKARELIQHFEQQSTPIMVGGGVLAHTIIGVDFNEKNGDVSYLILDPHYTGAEDISTIHKKGWCGWKKSSFWDKNSFYNLCMPQRPQDY